MSDNYLLTGLRERGVKLTLQRRVICEWLADNESHPTAASVYEALHPAYPDLSLATVYNTISLLHELDLIHAVTHAADGSIRYDTNTAPHLNLVCSTCGSITDQPVPPEHYQTLQALAFSQKFQIRDTNLLVHGICSFCYQDKSL